MSALPKPWMTLASKPAMSPIALAGAEVRLDLSGALHLPAHRALVVADLHLEKGSAYARRGTLLPPYDTRETLAALAEVVERLAPATVIALGDSFHDAGGPERLAGEDRAALARLQAGRRWVWITGNHDPRVEGVGGEVVAELALGPLRLRHEPTVAGEAEVAGHLHPVGKVVLRGRAVRRRAFLTDGRRLVLPAFGAYAGGLNACDAAFKPLFPAGFTAHLMGDGRLFAIGRSLLCRD